MNSQSLTYKIKDRCVLFLIKEINPPPLLFFLMYIYFHLQIQSSDYVAYAFFIVGLTFAILFSYNHFYLYSPVLNSGIGYWSILNMSLGILAANQKWKLYLYLFMIGDSITIQYPQISKIYTICCSLYLWIDIFRNLNFKTVLHNIMFFTGFFTIFMFQLFFKIISAVDGYSAIAYFIVPFSILIGYKLISSRVQRLKKKDILKIRNVEEAQHYISLIRQQIKSPYSREGYLQTHRDNCSNIECFCRNDHLLQGLLKSSLGFATKIQYYFIRNLYQKALESNNLPKKQFLQNKFIQFLLQNNQVTQAIEKYHKLQSLSAKFYYFRWVERTRIFYKIQQKLYSFDYFNTFSKQFVYVFEYDHSYLYLASQIKDILKRKVDFWRQVGKQTPMMVQLQQFGSLIVQKMYDLNNFYYKQIKQQQQKINNFNGTIMYAMYLLSTTNYKQFAESLIKNTSRTLQSIKIHEDNIAETYGLKVLIKDMKKSCNEKIQILDSIISTSDIQKCMQDISHYNSTVSLQKQNVDRPFRVRGFYQDGFVQIISNISGSLCKLLNTTKNDLLGKDMNAIIPVSYQERHHSKLARLLHYDQKTNKQLVNLSFINKLRQVPLKTANNRLMNVKISVKIFQDINQGISFIALVQTINENKVTLITNLDGELQQYEEGLGNLKILQCRQIKSVISQLKEEWRSTKTLSSRKINIAFNDNNYSISFSSPYQQSFVLSASEAKEQQVEEQDEQNRRLYHKQNQTVQLTPPIHIDITNQSIPYLANAKQDREEQMTKCIKKMESVFYKTDIDSQSSTNSSRKSSVVNVLMSFSENYFIPFYGYIMAVFCLILIGSIVSNSIGYSQLNLPWDNSIQQKNPIINIISMMDIRSLMIRTINHQSDIYQYKFNTLINTTNINLFYGLDKTVYPVYVQQQMKRVQIKYKKAVTSTSMYVADVLSQKLNTAWQILVNTTNPNNPDPLKRTQQLPLQNIFMNYLVDLDLLSLGKPYPKTLVSLNFWSTVEYMISKISDLNDNISDAIGKTVILNILYCCVLAVSIAVSIIPVYILLKKRVKRHIDIYDLIVSVEGQLIGFQIKKLQSIITIVNNCNESSQVLKTNTINYLARKRSSAINDNREGSNQMIEGLIQIKNDSITQHQGQSVISEGRNTKQKFLQSKIQNPLSSLKEQDNQIICQDSSKLKLRKRSGQLDLRNSQGDLKKIVLKHWVLYLIILISTFALFAIAVSKINYFKSVKLTFLKVEDIYQNFIQESILLYNAKQYFRGMPNVNFVYHDMNFMDWLQKRIYANAPVNFDSQFQEQKVYPACNIAISQMNMYWFCRKQYSLLTLRQQVNHYIKQSYEQRLNLNIKYNITNDNLTSVPANQLKDMSQHYFYIQSMNDRISNITNQYVNDITSQMLRDDNDLNVKLKVIFIAGLTWGIICLILGFWLINHMKKLYFKQIIIVSFLNNQMISKNKRVQSFLQTLSKSSY